ncbi:Zinc finger C2H2-type, partial [Cinara cedri]
MEPYERRDTDGEDYMRAMEATRKHLPNLRKIIDKWKYLNIQKQHAEMLIALYKMLDTKELSLSKLLTSEKFIIKLSNNYHKFLEEECTLDAKNTNKLDGCENKTNSSSEINLTMKKIDLNLDSMWDIPNNNMATSSNTDNFTHNYQLKSVDYDFKRKKEGINKDKDATLPEFSDSRLQVNELIGLEAIEKLDTADESISNTLSLHSQPQFIVSSVLSKSSTVPDKLNTDINVFHKIGSSNDPKQKLITPLKPDTLIDHTNSKLTRASLLMESIRSVVPSNNKNTDDKRFQRPDNGSQHDSLSVYNGQTSQKAKYGKGKYSNYSDRIDQKEKVGQCMLNLENQKFKSSNRTNAKESTSSFGVKNSTDKIINCKIPIIKHIEELIEQNTKKNMTETVIIKNNFKINSLTDTIEDNALKKSSATEIITNCKIEKKLKTGTINDDDKIESGNDKSHEISLKKSVINIDNKDEKKIAKKQCHIIKESTRAKKIKMCSEETEVEKIVKEASSLKEDTCGPKIRTRSSLKKIGEPLKEVVPNKKRICLDIREHSENIEYVENVNTEQDVILSTSIEESEGVTPIKRECTNFEESIVSSNELSSTVDTRTNPIYLSSKVDLQNPGILTIFELLRDEQKQLKLKEFLNATDTKNIRDDEPKCKNVSSEEHSHFEHNKLKEKKGRKLDKNNTIVVKNSSNNQESKNALLNTCLDNDFNKGSMVIENSNSGINFDHSSTSQGKVKLSKQKKLKKNYGNFKIKNKNLPDNEIQDLKVVITRCDKNSSFTDKNDQFKIRPNYEIISKEKSNKSNCKLKNKKIKTNEIEEKDVPSVLAKPQKKDPINENPTLGISTLQDQYNTIDQSSEKMTTLQSNVNNTTVRKRTKRYITELEKLRLGAGQAYGSDDVLHERRIRKCRQNKKIDYCYTNTVVLSEKNYSSTIEQLDDQANISISNNKKSKTFKKQTKNKKKTIQVKTLKALTPEDFKDKLYFQTVDNKLECKLCSYNDIGLKIVRHYKEDHSVEEMLPSRLSVDTAEILINESVKENFGILNVLDLKPLSDVVLVNITLTCVFCYSIFYDITCFYDHITCHTGEYRYNCKVCKMTYPNVLELDKHISEHTNYDKSGGIFHLSQSNPVGSNTIFGYLCPFCYYIQLDYQRTLNHMIERHFNEDKKLNSYWTIIRVNMSIGDDKYTNSIVDYSNLVGCLPLILNDKVILKDENQTQKTGVSTIVVKNKQAMKNAGSSGIHLYNEVEVHLPKLNINSLVNKIR